MRGARHLALSALLLVMDSALLSSAGNPSNVITFSVLYGNPVGPPPSIIEPTGNPTLTLPITLSCTDGYNPQELDYEVQISSSSSFTTIEQPTAGHTDPRRVVSSLTSGPKFWRVRSHQGSASPTTAAVTAWSARGTFTVMPPTLKSDPLQPEVRAIGGPTMAGRLDLAGGGFAPAGGFPVGVSSSPRLATVPAKVTIPAGANSTALTIQTSAVTTTTIVTIKATPGAVTAEWQLTLTPAPPPTSLTLRPVSTTNGSQGIVTIATGSIAGHDQLLRVTSSNPAVASHRSARPG